METSGDFYIATDHDGTQWAGGIFLVPEFGNQDQPEILKRFPGGEWEDVGGTGGLVCSIPMSVAAAWNLTSIDDTSCMLGVGPVPLRGPLRPNDGCGASLHRPFDRPRPFAGDTRLRGSPPGRTRPAVVHGVKEGAAAALAAPRRRPTSLAPHSPTRPPPPAAGGRHPARPSPVRRGW